MVWRYSLWIACVRNVITGIVVFSVTKACLCMKDDLVKLDNGETSLARLPLFEGWSTPNLLNVNRGGISISLATGDTF